MSQIKFFLAGNTAFLEKVFPDQERKIPGKPEIPEVFLARKSLICDIRQDSRLEYFWNPGQEELTLLRYSRIIPDWWQGPGIQPFLTMYNTV
jgi:hypothetical protein